jgi:hypothetical protein
MSFKIMNRLLHEIRVLFSLNKLFIWREKKNYFERVLIDRHKHRSTLSDRGLLYNSTFLQAENESQSKRSLVFNETQNKFLVCVVNKPKKKKQKQQKQLPAKLRTEATKPYRNTLIN